MDNKDIKELLLKALKLDDLEQFHSDICAIYGSIKKNKTPSSLPISEQEKWVKDQIQDVINYAENEDPDVNTISFRLRDILGKLNTLFNHKHIVDKIPALPAQPNHEKLWKDGIWYETINFRQPKKNEVIWLMGDNRIEIVDDNLVLSYWILRPIPCPTNNQLNIIHAMVDGDKPKWCNAGDVVWHDGKAIEILYSASNNVYPAPDYRELIGTKLRWHIKSESTIRHTQCNGCNYGDGKDCHPLDSESPCDTCPDDMKTLLSVNTSIRRNWTNKKQKKNTMHEECYKCALQNTNSKECKGHIQGPVSCPDFIAKPELNMHYSCEGCTRTPVGQYCKVANECLDRRHSPQGGLRKLYTTKQQKLPVSLFVREPTNAEIVDACISYRHDFGLLSSAKQNTCKFIAKEWLIAWQKQMKY